MDDTKNSIVSGDNDDTQDGEAMKKELSEQGIEIQDPSSEPRDEVVEEEEEEEDEVVSSDDEME